MKTAKQIKTLVAFLLAALLISVNIPFSARAAVDDVFAQGDIIYFVTAEGSGSKPGKVTAAFNEDKDPSTVNSIKVPCSVKNGGNSYNVTEFTNNAFSGCKALTKLDLSECTHLSLIGTGAFIDCTKLTSITVPCNFNKNLFENTGVVINEDKFTIEYVSLGEGEQSGLNGSSGGTFTYVHDWQVNSKNYAEHICKNCSKKETHNFKPDKNNSKQHKCTVCNYTEAHYGGTATCSEKAKCIACGSEYETDAPVNHDWEVMPETIGSVSASYKCEDCRKTETREMSFDKNTVNYNGQNLNTILQDPYKVLPDGTNLKTTLVAPGSARYDELLAQIDDTYKIENIAFFELELNNAQQGKISGKIAGKVRILLQIPDGWDKEDLEAVLIMTGSDIEFEESIITIDGVDYLAFWTNHFSPYALIDVSNENENSKKKNTDKTSPDTGSFDVAFISVLALVFVSASTIIFIAFKRKKKEI